MPPTKTNSNSITSIFIYALNNKKSGFREAMLKRFRDIKKTNGDKFDIPEDIVFHNGSFKSLALKEMNGTKIDIYGLSGINNVPKIMIEIKANLEEDLQDTQNDKGAYRNTARAYNIPLVYIIPNKYIHENKLPKSEEKTDKKNELIVTKIYWSEVRDIARNYDNTGLDNQIETFVQLIDNDGEDLLFTKNELALIISPNLIWETYEYIFKFKTCIKNYTGKKSKEHNNQYGIGYSYDDDKYWLGLIPSHDEKQYFFSLCISADKIKKQDFKKPNDIYFDGEYYYCPYKSKDFKAKINFTKLESELNKYSDLEKWFLDSEKRIKEINLVYCFADKIIALINNYMSKNNLTCKKYYWDKYGIGVDFEDTNHFLGFKPKKPFSIAIKKSCIKTLKADNAKINNDGKWYYFPLSEERDLFNTFIFSDTADEQQDNFNILVNEILNTTKKYLK